MNDIPETAVHSDLVKLLDSERQKRVEAKDHDSAGVWFEAVAKVRELEGVVARSHRDDWTAAICDRLNSLVRENRPDFEECKDGPTASQLVQHIHARYNSLGQRARELEAIVGKLPRTADGVVVVMAETPLKKRLAKLYVDRFVAGEHKVASLIMGASCEIASLESEVAALRLRLATESEADDDE